MAAGNHKLRPKDLDNFMDSENGEIIVNSSEGFVQVPMAYGITDDGTPYGYIAKATLVVGERPTLKWTGDEAYMLDSFEENKILPERSFDGKYQLDSQRGFTLDIDNGIASRQDFKECDDHPGPTLYCPESHSFQLKDTTLGGRSTYIQVTQDLIMEFSPNSKGKIFLWRKMKEDDETAKSVIP